MSDKYTIAHQGSFLLYDNLERALTEARFSGLQVYRLTLIADVPVFPAKDEVA